MDITSGISVVKAIASVVEKKFPGTCTDLVSELEGVTHSSGWVKYKVQDFQEKWDSIKDKLSNADKSAITDQINASGIAVDSSTIWSDGGLVDSVDFDGVVDSGILDSIGDFISGFFD